MTSEELSSFAGPCKMSFMTPESPDIQPGSIVLFREPFPDELDAEGQQIPMKVLEVNGDRCRLEAIVDMAIRPQCVHLLKDLMLTEHI